MGAAEIAIEVVTAEKVAYNLGRMTSKVYTGSADSMTTPSVTYSYATHNPAIAGVTSYAAGRRTRVEVAGGTLTMPRRQLRIQAEAPFGLSRD